VFFENSKNSKKIKAVLFDQAQGPWIIALSVLRIQSRNMKKHEFDFAKVAEVASHSG
jgi:hypothetical protein